MGIIDYLSNFAETSETNSNENLKTRYYKNKYTDVRDVVTNYAKKNNIEIRSINDNHGEIFLQSNKYHLIVTVVQITPIETAVEIKVQTYFVTGRHRAKKIIIDVYKELDNHLTFKGISLHP